MGYLNWKGGEPVPKAESRDIFSALVDLPPVLFRVRRKSALGFIVGFPALKIVEKRSQVLRESSLQGYALTAPVRGWATVILKGPKHEYSEIKEVMLRDPQEVPSFRLRGRIVILPYMTPEAIKTWAIRGRGPHREEWYLMIELLPLAPASPRAH
jgi:hypothetical protein